MNLTSQSREKVKVAVVDRGLDCALPESDGWVVSGQDINGTMWAGIIRERAPEAEIYRIQIGGEKCGQALVKAITWCIDRDMDVVNIGFGTTDVMFKNALLDVCRKAVRGGTVLVAAAYANDLEVYPAVFSEVIGVADGRVDAPDGYAYQKHQVIECTVDAQRSFWFNGNRVMRANFTASYVTGFVAGFLQNHPNASLQKIRHLLAINSVVELGRRESRSAVLSNTGNGVAKLWREFDTYQWIKKRLALAGQEIEPGS